ncbi:MAG: hypothetical protein ACK4PK_08770 [Alphaproteobacteria bacterium]
MKTPARLSILICSFVIFAVFLSAGAVAQDGGGHENYLLDHRLKAGRKMFDSNPDAASRIRVEDSVRARAAREKAEQLAAEKAREKQNAEEEAALAAVTATSATQIPCQKLDDLLKIIVSQRRLGYLADAVDNTGIVHMWFMSRERREWVSLTVNHDLTACITAQGSSWNFALEPMQPE